jgi:thiamine pyrophosphate-dependent acetolactate synthase large subunit-like protein
MATDVAAFLRVAQRVLARAAFDAATLDERTAANADDREAYERASVVDAVPWTGPGVHPGRVVTTLARVLPPDTIISTDAGDFGTWAARGYRFRRPGTFVGSTAGPMGFGLPAAIGATLARPGRLGVALAGDGGFAMTMAELETAVRERARVIVVVFDNGRYGTIWRAQEERPAGGGLGTRLGSIDFAAVAAACGALGLSVSSDAEFEPALQQAIESGRPALLHLALDPAWTTPDFAPSVRPAVPHEPAQECTQDEIDGVAQEAVPEIVEELAEAAASEPPTELAAEAESETATGEAGPDEGSDEPPEAATASKETSQGVDATELEAISPPESDQNPTE